MSWGAVEANRVERGPSAVEPGQRRLDLGAVRLLPRWEPERASQLGRELVHGESRRGGRRLEQHAAGLAEVDRLEVRPVADFGYVAAPTEELGPERELRLGAPDREGDMVHGPE